MKSMIWLFELELELESELEHRLLYIVYCILGQDECNDTVHRLLCYGYLLVYSSIFDR